MIDLRPIDAHSAIKALTGWDTDPTDEEIKMTIDGLPTLDYAPVVHGEWLKEQRGIRRCSYCDKGYRITNGGPNVMNFAYCPNCGAKIDGGKQHV